MSICPNCQRDLKPITPPFCPRCGLPFLCAEDDKVHLCSHCLKEKRYFELHRSFGLYEGALKEAIHRFKYLGEFPLLKVFADLMSTTFQALCLDHPVDLIVPVPLHVRRLRQRGFNQALLLAKELSKRTGIRYGQRVLRKVKDTPFQSTLKGTERRKNIKGAFHVNNTEEARGKSILLVDDVCTTGATVNECARTLLNGGAERVVALTLARVV
ncbi:MAG: ComF family protein [Deltaproteobacteria bacterium]|nr:MAG: ComF family protein [Deltaproteobacteria bacterium]